MSKINRYKVSWKEYDKHIRILVKKIQKKGEKYELIYTVSRGGLIILTHLSHLLNIKRIQIDSVPLERGKILIVDDVSDTGKTLEKLLLWRKELPTDIATLYRKNGTKVEPQFCVKTINQWIVYPWEV